MTWRTFLGRFRGYDGTVDLKEHSKDNAAEVESSEGQQTENVGFFTPDGISQDSSETKSVPFFIGVPLHFLETYGGEFLASVCSLLPPVYKSGTKGFNRQDAEDLPKPSLPKTNEERSTKASTGLDDEQDAKDNVNNSRKKTGKLKKNTEDHKTYNGVTSYAPVKKKHVFWFLMFIFSGNCVNGWQDSCLCLQTVYLKVSEEGTIPCWFSEPYATLCWLPEDRGPCLIYIEGGQQKGPGYVSKDYEMSRNGSLTIKKVNWRHNRNRTLLYVPTDGAADIYCTVSVKVYGVGDPGYPVVNGLADRQNVTLHVNHQGNINCTLSGIRPELDLEFDYPQDVLSLQSSRSIAINTDGTINASIFASLLVCDGSVGTVLLSCRAKGEWTNVLPATTVSLVLDSSYPMINGLLNKQSVVLHVRREDTVTCSMSRILKQSSVEFKLTQPNSEIELTKSSLEMTNNSDGTHNVTLTSKLSVLSPRLHDFTAQCKVSGQAADTYQEVTMVHFIIDKDYPMVNGSLNKQSVVLHAKREDTVTCSMSRIPKQSSVEFKLTQPNSEIKLTNSFFEINNNSDGTHNVTLTSKLSVLSPRFHHFTAQCKVSGQAADTYQEVIIVHFIIDKDDVEEQDSHGHGWIPAVIAVAVLLVVVSLVALFCWNHKRNGDFNCLVKTSWAHLCRKVQNGETRV